MLHPKRLPPEISILSVAVATLTAALTVSAQERPALEEVIVWGSAAEQRAFPTHPGSLLTPRDLVSINISTTEDVVKYEPGLVIRRRFIGDANGTMGMRGSNMFQTSRSMVFADGVPLHYLLQSRWNGAPRWTMVSASEIARVEVLYGPYSAEFSGNAMGGVVLIESAIPQQREFHFDSSFFSQTFNAYGFDDTVNGYKSFFSFGDKIGDTSIYLSYNRLDSESQPQNFYFGANTVAGNVTDVSGGIVGNDELSTSRLWFGDTGIQDTLTENYKLKLGHDFGDWQTLLNIAYEDRYNGANKANSYLRSAAGATVWSGNVAQNGWRNNIPSARLGISSQERDSLSIGLRLRGALTDKLTVEANVNQFDILRDDNRASLANPQDPHYTLAGQVTSFGDTGWRSAEIKLQVDDFGFDGLAVVTGFRHDAYELNMDVFDTPDHRSGNFGNFTSRSGGNTKLNAVFAQLNWAVSPQWDVGLGLRAEAFSSHHGYYSRDVGSTEQLDLVTVPGSAHKKVSPKFSAGYQLNAQWRLAYALGQAYRFPIVEELFSQYSAYNAISVANPGLNAEDGVHQNLMIEREIRGGHLRVNIFQESVRDVIESQSEMLPGGLSVRTFIPMDEIETRGIEFIANVDDLLIDNLSMRFNLVNTDSTIVKNRADLTIVGNSYPRMPQWRSNLLLSYYFSSNWSVGINHQYASDSFGRNDNRDREHKVFGAQDGFSRTGLKTDYHFANGLKVGFGIDNLTDEVAYVAHPWPGRTLFANVSIDF